MASDWKEVSLGDIFNVKHGFAFKGQYFTDEQKPTILVTPGNFAIGGGFQNPKPKYYDGQIPQEYVLKPGQIIITMTDLSKQSDTLGYTAIVPDDGNIWLHNQRIGLLEFKESFPSDPIFINYLLRSHKYRSWITGSASGTTVKHTSPSRIHAFKCDVPPISEQRAIAHILGSLDDKIELNRRMNQTLEAIARAIFKSWFVDFLPVRAKIEGRSTGLPDDIAALFPDSFEDSEMREIPKGWEVKTIGDVAEFAYGKALKASDRKPGDVPVFGSNGQVGLHNEALVKGPGIVIGRKGNPGIVTWSYEDFFPIDTTFYVKESGIVPSLNYLFYALKDQDLPSLSADSAVPGLNRNLAYMSKFLVPSKKILPAFDGQIDPLFQTIDANENEIKTLASLRDTLLPKLISGELRVPDADKFVEEASV
jgi:type I restriction enzyme S subunit